MYRKLLRENRDFARVYFAGLISTAGDVLFDILLMWTVYSKTGKAADLGLVLIANYLAKGAVSLISGHLVDVFPRKRLMIAADIARGIMVLAFLAILDPAQNRLAILGFIFAIETMTALFDAAKLAFVPDIVGKDRVVVASSLTGASARVVAIAGAVVAGVLVESLRPGTIVLLDSASFFISAALVGGCRGPVRQAAEAVQPALAGIGAAYREAVSTVLKDRFILSFMLLVMALNFPYSLIQLVPVLGADAQTVPGAFWIGIFRGAQSAGEIIGLYLIGTTLLSRMIFRCFTAGLLGCALGYLLLSRIGVPALALAGLFIYGLTDALTQPLFSYFTAYVPSSHRGKVLGLFDCAVLIVVPAAMFAAGRAIDLAGLAPVCMAASATLLLAAVVFVSRPEFSGVDAQPACEQASPSLCPAKD